MNTTAAFAVHETSQVSEARRAAALLADRLGFSAARAGQVALVVTELATNLAKHARSGEILLRALDNPAEPPGIEVLAIDKGPGIPDVALSRRDGFSTVGTLGHGFGAIERQSDYLEVYTLGSGTVVLAQIHREAAPQRAVVRPAFAVGGVLVSKPGETICGDAWSWRLDGERLSVIVADGLGHGLAAHDAAREAVLTFERSPGEPLRTLEDVHAALRAYRGAAVAVLAIDAARRETRYAALGNISSVVLTDQSSRHSLVSHNGTAGHTAPRLQEFISVFPPDSIIVMHSDGLATHWTLAPYPGIGRRHPSVIAGLLYRDFARRRDDVTVVVAKGQSAAHRS